MVNGEVEQEYLCEDCSYYLKEEKYYRQMLLEIDEIKAWQEAKKKDGKI